MLRLAKDNEDSCSWYEFACEILKDKNVEVAPVTFEEYPQKAYRPRHSIMSLKKAETTGFTIPVQYPLGLTL